MISGAQFFICIAQKPEKWENGNHYKKVTEYLEDSGKLIIFAADTNKYSINMLGIDTPHKPIEGKFADEIRDVVRRMSTGKLNESDKKMIRRSRKVLEKYDAVWK